MTSRFHITGRSEGLRWCQLHSILWPPLALNYMQHCWRRSKRLSAPFPALEGFTRTCANIHIGFCHGDPRHYIGQPVTAQVEVRKPTCCARARTAIILTLVSHCVHWESWGSKKETSRKQRITSTRPWLWLALALVTKMITRSQKCCIHWARLSQQTGDLKGGIRFLQESLNVQRSLHGDCDHPSTAATLQKLGDLTAQGGDTKQGIQFLQESLRMQRSLHGDRAHPGIAATLQKLGDLNSRSGDLKQAIKFLQESLQVQAVRAWWAWPSGNRNHLAQTWGFDCAEWRSQARHAILSRILADAEVPSRRLWSPWNCNHLCTSWEM